LNIVAGSGAFSADCEHPTEWKASCQNASCMGVLSSAKRTSRQCRSESGSWRLITWVFFNVGEVEVYGLAKQSEFDFVMIVETELKVGMLCCAICYQTKRTGETMIWAVKGQRAYTIDGLKAGITL